MHVLALRADLHIPHAQSLKAKRSVVQSLVQRIDGWSAVAAAEVDGLDTWQRAVIGVSVIASSPSRAEELADRVERTVWSTAGVEVLSIERVWTEHDGWERV